ncbi:MAG: hypothetical protein H6536_00020 [Bacteroidales bacterium]|nr:hypothetical protein [Bacteroidales bacterium]
MKNALLHIMYRTLGTLLVSLTVATAAAQLPVQYIEAYQCETIEFSVMNWTGDRYTWDLYSETDWLKINFATEKGDVEPAAYFEKGKYEGSTVRVNWLEPGIYVLRVMVWDETICNNNLHIFKVNVLEHELTATLQGDSVCYGEPVVFKIVLTGMGPWDLKYTFGDGTASLNLNGITEPEQAVYLPPLPTGQFDVWVTEIIDQCSQNLIPSEKARIVIYPKPANSQIILREK